MSRMLRAAPLRGYGMPAQVSSTTNQPSSSIASNNQLAADIAVMIPSEKAVQPVRRWLPPRMPKVDSKYTKVRITAVDGCFQVYGHLRSARQDFKLMKVAFHERYELCYHDEDVKEEWKLGEACIAKNSDDSQWYRAQVVQIVEGSIEIGIIFVDLGCVRSVFRTDLRVARAFGDLVCSNKLSLFTSVIS